jgi:hypothetical protein
MLALAVVDAQVSPLEGYLAGPIAQAACLVQVNAKPIAKTDKGDAIALFARINPATLPKFTTLCRLTRSAA